VSRTVIVTPETLDPPVAGDSSVERSFVLLLTGRRGSR
jgi:hypothetical protein